MSHELGDKKNHFGIVKAVRDAGERVILEIQIEPPEQGEFLIEMYNWMLGDKVEVRER